MKSVFLSLLILTMFSNLSYGQQKNPVILIETTMGDIKLELYPEKAPITVKNFLNYVNSGFYEGTIFHRVISNFMIQGGGFTKDFHMKKTNPPIKNEANNGLKNKRGTISMARTMHIHSATAQFFINVADNDFLDHRDDSIQGFGYAVFGKVVSGMDVVDKISKVKTGNVKGFDDVPLTPVVINSIKVLK